MLDSSKLVEKIASDLMSDRPVSEILLQLKLLASVKGDSEMLKWVTLELEGYEDKPPDYRILPSRLMVEVAVPYAGSRVVDFPIEVIKIQAIRDRLSNMPIHNPISEIEQLCRGKDEGGSIEMPVPVHVYRSFSGFIRGSVQRAYQSVTKAALAQVIVSIKSLLIDYLLALGKEEDINFNAFINNNQKMIDKSVTINAGIYNAGDGTVNAQGATTVVGDNNIIGEGNKEELLKILAQIDELAASAQLNPEYKEVSNEIKEELKKQTPANNLLKRCFQLIPTFFANVGAGIIANKLTPLIASAIALL